MKQQLPLGGYGNNAACVGSGTVSYGAMAWQFMEQDFTMRSTYGDCEGSTLDDWPITYADLEPCYEKAECEIGVAGDMSPNPFSPPRRKPDPMPPFPLNREGRLLDSAAKRLGFHPFPIPMLRNSVPCGGRNACIARLVGQGTGRQGAFLREPGETLLPGHRTALDLLGSRRPRGGSVPGSAAAAVHAVPRTQPLPRPSAGLLRRPHSRRRP